MNEAITPALEQAIYAYKNGQTSAFSVIVEESEQYVYTYVRYLFGNRSFSEDEILDGVQYIYEELGRTLAGLSSAADFYSYIYGIAERVCAAYVRERSWSFPEEMENTEIGEFVIPASVAESQEKQHYVRDILFSELNDYERMVLVSHYCGNRATERIAQDLGVTEQAVLTILAHAKYTIKTNLLALESDPSVSMCEIAPWVQYFEQEDAYYCQVPQKLVDRIGKVCGVLAAGTGAIAAGMALTGADAVAGGAGAAGSAAGMSGGYAAMGTSGAAYGASAVGSAGGYAGVAGVVGNSAAAGGAAGNVAVAAAGGAAGNGVAGTAVATVGKVAAGKGIGAFFATVGGKITIGAVATALAVGGGVAAHHVITEHQADPADPAPVVATASDATITDADGTTEMLTQNTLTDEQIYVKYMNENLLPLYGASDLNGQTVDIQYSDDYNWEAPNWISANNGILSSSIEDYDGDGTKELIVFRMDRGEKGGYSIEASLYKRNEDSVTLCDCQTLGFAGAYNAFLEGYTGNTFFSLQNAGIEPDDYGEVQISTGLVDCDGQKALCLYQQEFWHIAIPYEYYYTDDNHDTGTNENIYSDIKYQMIKVQDNKFVYDSYYNSDYSYLDTKSDYDNSSLYIRQSEEEYVLENGVIKGLGSHYYCDDSSWDDPTDNITGDYQDFETFFRGRGIQNITANEEYKSNLTAGMIGSDSEIFNIMIAKNPDAGTSGQYQLTASLNDNTSLFDATIPKTKEAEVPASDAVYLDGTLALYYYNDGNAQLKTTDGREIGLVFMPDTKLQFDSDDLYLEAGSILRVELGDATTGTDEYIADQVSEWYEVKSVFIYNMDMSYSGMEKPVIYLYPEKREEVSVKLHCNGKLTCTYPDYRDGWKVTAEPDGTLYDADGKQYNYLYWEGVTNQPFDMSRGFCVEGKDTAAFLEESLEKLGLTRKEANEFIIYWLPRMQNNKYNIISFQTTAYTDNAVLDIDPLPDTTIRIFMAWKSVDEKIDIKPQVLTAPKRKGFTVVEWGGSEVGSKNME